MSYIPSYMEWLQRAESHANGYPKFVTPEAQEWAERRVREIVEESGTPLNLNRIVDKLLCSPPSSELPECLRKMVLWDAKYGVTYRALLGADMETRWLPVK